MKKLLILFSCFAFGITLSAQNFEEAKDNGENFEKASVKVGGDFAIQFQGLSHEADNNSLIPIGKGINLPTANLNLDATLGKGIKLNLVTYLSSRHHNETWVKGGYLIMDQLPFLKSTAVDNIMNYLTLKVGVMEVNYGDAHFRRTDNGAAMRNPFVGNYIMDAFTTAPAMEIMFRHNGIIAMAAVNTGSLRQDLALSAKKLPTDTVFTYTPYSNIDELAYYGKVGYDKEITTDLRLRATLSAYYLGKHHSGSLYNGDRAGARYYLIMNRMNPKTGEGVDITKNAASTYFGPSTVASNTSLMANLFLSYKGAEIFGIFENVSAEKANGSKLNFNQLSGEALYRFGGEKQFFGGVRYNKVIGKTEAKTATGFAPELEQTVDRIQVGAGWFLLPSTVVKLEYVNQNYDNFAEFGGKANFSGVMFEAAVSF